MNATATRINAGKKATLTSILADLNNDDWDCLYYASEIQINKLIDNGKISEDFFSRHQEYQEEMNCMIGSV